MIGLLREAFHRRLLRRAGHLARRIAPHLPTGATVLDIGSGTGHNAEALRSLGARACVEADVVDFHVVGGGPVLFDGARLPFAERVFDACLLAFEGGLKLARVIPESGLLGLVSRDLFILERRFQSPILAASTPRPRTQRP